MNDLPEVVEQLASRVDSLEKRVAKLEEGSMEAVSSVVPESAAQPQTLQMSATPLAGMFPVLGRALLGVAGAYVLRALTAAGVLPRPLIAAAGIVYALAWLIAASRAVSRNRLAGALYAATSALILAPMLWEMCLRFQVLSADFAAGVLAVYSIAATSLAFRNHRSSAVFFAYAGAALTALALAIGTHVMAPFTLILIAMLLICEIARLINRPLAVHPIIVAAADFAAWALLFIYRAPASTRADYPALGTVFVLIIACLPFFVSAPAIALRTLHLRQDMTVIDIVQGVLSFVLLGLAISWLLPSSGGALFGVVCLVLGLACYTIMLGPFRRAVHPLNFRVAALWSAALLLSGLFLALQPTLGAVAVGGAALAAVLLGDHLHCMTAELHGVFYLFVAAAAAGQLVYIRHALIGQVPHTPDWPILVLSCVAVAAYLLGDERPGEDWHRQALHLATALLAVSAVAALLVRGLVSLTEHFIVMAEFHVAFLRTFALCALAVVLAFAASRWHRLESKRLAYTALVFVAAKLLFEDMRYGRMEFIAGSIFLVALTFIAVPRLAQRAPAA